MPNTLKLLPSGDKLIANIAALDANIVRYIGRRLDRDLRGFVPTGEPDEQPFHPDYVLHVKRGDLLPGDEATALMCGVAWTGARKK